MNSKMKANVGDMDGIKVSPSLPFSGRKTI